MAAPSHPAEDASQEATADAWLAAFHEGGRTCLDACYREHFEAVDRTVGRILVRGDRETVVHEVFYRLIADRALRLAFQGGSFSAWLRTVARNQAIDYARRRGLEVPTQGDLSVLEGTQSLSPRLAHQVEARLIMEKFRSEVLPPKWRRVFDARFLEQRDQPDAARSLGMSRTTLAYQEYRIRKLIRRFVLRGDVL